MKKCKKIEKYTEKKSIFQLGTQRDTAERHFIRYKDSFDLFVVSAGFEGFLKETFFSFFGRDEFSENFLRFVDFECCRGWEQSEADQAECR